MCKTDSTRGDTEQQTHVLDTNFDRIPEEYAVRIAGATLKTVNRNMRSFRAVATISNLVLASMVAEECAEPNLPANVVGDLLYALIELSSLAADDIETLADWADRHIGKDATHD
ncbi:hypothetical protein [Burkholderia gladioli]|uniref:hypothetical protein n=1 Tax=Burkholderia gladioli TaxID=28095 RepID=UPI0034DB130B